MATILAPASRASFGSISGLGFAIAKTIGSAFIERTISCESTSFALTPMNASAPFIASARVPFTPLGLVRFASAFCAKLKRSLSSITPSLSQTIRSVAPKESKNSAIAIPALPAPFITKRAVDISFLTTLSAFLSAAARTIAVPCWSS